MLNKMRRQLFKRQQGAALFITLLVLFILTTVIVQFQVKASLYLRSNLHREEKLTCQYAAESGVIIAMSVLKEKLRSPNLLEGVGKSGGKGGSGPLPVPAIPIPGLGGTGGANEDDPNLLDPNSQDGNLELLPDNVVVVAKDTIEFDGITVDYEVHDENAKFPMMWMVPNGSPFSSNGVKPADRQFNRLAQLLIADKNAILAAMDMAVNIGNMVNMPQQDVSIIGQGRQRRRRIRGQSKRLQVERNRRNAMGLFVDSYYKYMKEEPVLAKLNEPLENRENTFMDYMGFWGHNKLNINTASPEVLESAFHSIGLDSKKVQAIVDFRETDKFSSANDLQKVDGIDLRFVQTIKPLAIGRSETFSIHVVAKAGRTEYRLRAGVYYHRNRLNRIAVLKN